MADLKAFRLMAGAHVGPDYTQDPEEVDVLTASGLVTRSEFPTRQFKARVAGAARTPGDSNVVYSPDDLSKKFNAQNSTKFVALGDAPKDVNDRFQSAVESGNLSPRQGGVKGVGRRRPVGNFGSRTSSTSEIGPGKGTTDPDPKNLSGDPRDVTPEGAEGGDEPEDLHALTKDDLRAKAEEEGVDVPSRATKEELIEAIESARKK